MKLSDGRAFEYEDNGVKSDKAILLLHGTPGSCKTWSDWLSQVTDCLVIAGSRAGYGNSDRHLGRTVADDLSDQQTLLVHFGVKEFVSIGWSGGGPHSINMTREPRCKGAITKPVLVWQGDDDFMVPKAHSEWLVKHIPTATLNFIPGQGHISLVTAYRSQIIEQALELLKA